MATVKRGVLSKPGLWWKHLRRRKRLFLEARAASVSSGTERPAGAEIEKGRSDRAERPSGSTPKSAVGEARDYSRQY